MMATWVAGYLGVCLFATEIENSYIEREERALGVYLIEGAGATAKPEGMTGGAMRSLRRIERNLE